MKTTLSTCELPLPEKALNDNDSNDNDLRSEGKEVKPLLLTKSTKDRSRSFIHNSNGFTSAFTHLSDAIPLQNLNSLSSDSHDEINIQHNADFLLWLVQLTKQSDTAVDMLKEAAKDGWMLELDDLGSHDFHLDVPEKTIVLNTHGLDVSALNRTHYFRNLVIIAFARALRDVWQEKRHGGFEDNFGPESILMLERVRAADCDTMAVLIAWELRSAGFTDIWRHTVGSEEGDMAMAFYKKQKRLTADESGLHETLAHTFKQWFTSEDRISVCDHETLEYLDNFIAYEGVESFGSTYLTATHLEILSCLPDKTAYLRGFGKELIADPAYSGLNDEINQAHFMHLMHDMQAVTVAGVPFRSEKLASLIFPAQQSKSYQDA